MSLTETPLINTLSRALDLTSLRQRLVSENIANTDTPGYKTRDIDFRSELQKSLTGDASADLPPEIRTVASLEERPDGNNVNIDRESLLMAHNQLQFQAGVALLRTEFNRLQLAISGGSSS